MTQLHKLTPGSLNKFEIGIYLLKERNKTAELLGWLEETTAQLLFSVMKAKRLNFSENALKLYASLNWR